jgi:alpha-L-fucosidase
VYYFDIPEEALDAEITVMAIELDEPVKLYCGPGLVISFNDNELK